MIKLKKVQMPYYPCAIIRIYYYIGGRIRVAAPVMAGRY